MKKKPIKKKPIKKKPIKKVLSASDHRTRKKVSTRKKQPKLNELSLQEFFEQAKKERHLIVFFTINGTEVLLKAFRNQWPHGKSIVCANIMITALRKTHEKETGKSPW